MTGSRWGHCAAPERAARQVPESRERSRAPRASDSWDFLGLSLKMYSVLVLFYDGNQL